MRTKEEENQEIQRRIGMAAIDGEPGKEEDPAGDLHARILVDRDNMTGAKLVEKYAAEVANGQLNDLEAEEAAKHLARAAGLPIKTVRSAIKLAKPYLSGWEGMLSRTKEGSLKEWKSNLALIFENDPKYAGRLWWDSFADLPMVDNEMLNDQWVLSAAVEIGRVYGFGPRTNIVYEAALYVCALMKRNQALDHFSGFVWDGKHRLTEAATRYFGSNGDKEEDERRSLMLVYWWVSMCARIDKPGCKVDRGIVLEGGRGLQKSSALEIIGGAWYLDLTTDISSPAAWQEIAGMVVVELGELVSIVKARGNEKQIFSRKRDKFRAPYARTWITKDRTCVFAGTTNRNDYMDDPTGNRQYLPCMVYRVEIERLKRERDQLWAEAWQLYQSGFEYWTEAEFLMEETRNRLMFDPWENQIAEFLSNKTNADQHGRIVSRDILNFLDVPPSARDRKSERRIADILTVLGYKRARFKSGGITRSGYKPISR